MAVLVPSNTPRRHVIGELVLRHYTMTGTDGDTLTVPQSSILFTTFTPTTNISGGITVAGSTLTFHTGGAFTAEVAVFSRVG